MASPTGLSLPRRHQSFLPFAFLRRPVLLAASLLFVMPSPTFLLLPHTTVQTGIIVSLSTVAVELGTLHWTNILHFWYFFLSLIEPNIRLKLQTEKTSLEVRVSVLDLFFL